MNSSDEFQKELETIFAFAENKRLSAIILVSGELHRLVGGYPGSDHRMPICCSVMRKNLKSGDVIIHEPPSGEGATLTIKYQFPRIEQDS